MIPGLWTLFPITRAFSRSWVSACPSPTSWLTLLWAFSTHLPTRTEIWDGARVGILSNFPDAAHDPACLKATDLIQSSTEDQEAKGLSRHHMLSQCQRPGRRSPSRVNSAGFLSQGTDFLTPAGPRALAGSRKEHRTPFAFLHFQTLGAGWRSRASPLSCCVNWMLRVPWLWVRADSTRNLQGLTTPTECLSMCFPPLAFQVLGKPGLQVRQSCAHAHSVVFDSATPWSVALQAPLSMGFPRQEHWSGLPFPPPGDLPDPGIEPYRLLRCRQLLHRWATREAQGHIWMSCYSKDDLCTRGITLELLAQNLKPHTTTTESESVFSPQGVIPIHLKVWGALLHATV